MAHYAFLNEDYVVTEVIVGKDERLFDWENYYTIKKGQICKRTSYNTKGGIYYNPITKEVSFNSEKIVKWLKNGVQPTNTVKRILEKAKILNI